MSKKGVFILAINIISSGDLDYGKIKRYLCDTAEDFAELPSRVAAGSTVFVLSTGENYKINEEGNWILENSIGGGAGGEGIVGPQGPQGEAGKDGYTPIKGTDYWTEADKDEIIDDLLSTKPIKPYYDAERNYFFCNGVGVIIEDSGEDNKVLFDLDTVGHEELRIPYGARVLGGGDGSKRPCSYSGSAIVVNGGQLKSVFGGGLGGCNVGSASVVINGGKFTDGIFGGGQNNVVTDDATGNIVGYSSVVVNDCDSLTLYGGGGGLSRVGSADVEVNGGKIQWVTSGGSNGATGAVKITINNGEFTCVQSVNRGSIGSSIMTINGGTIKRLYGGGETEDTSVNGICGKSVLKILGGKVNKLAKGTSNGIESADFISGEYVQNVIGNEEITSELNLILTYTLEETIKKMLNIEESVVISNIGEA